MFQNREKVDVVNLKIDKIVIEKEWFLHDACGICKVLTNDQILDLQKNHYYPPWDR